ncbi:hypothetical protein A0H81_13864 [Grifola frondosa]|uniref:Uncharacterized protein n=1 Tax=Grifola frondosa TaxID=5627 RepID=A0A1C7LTS0_GRIFR|nr:hypothetical protein A0H81_13864 [Grifola frondosa]
MWNVIRKVYIGAALRSRLSWFSAAHPRLQPGRASAAWDVGNLGDGASAHMTMAAVQTPATIVATRFCSRARSPCSLYFRLVSELVTFVFHRGAFHLRFSVQQLLYITPPLISMQPSPLHSPASASDVCVPPFPSHDDTRTSPTTMSWSEPLDSVSAHPWPLSSSFHSSRSFASSPSLFGPSSIESNYRHLASLEQNSRGAVPAGRPQASVRGNGAALAGRERGTGDAGPMGKINTRIAGVTEGENAAGASAACPGRSAIGRRHTSARARAAQSRRVPCVPRSVPGIRAPDSQIQHDIMHHHPRPRPHPSAARHSHATDSPAQRARALGALRRCDQKTHMHRISVRTYGARTDASLAEGCQLVRMWRRPAQ